MKSILSAAGILLISVICEGGAIVAAPAPKDPPEARDQLQRLNENLSRIVTLLEQSSKRQVGDVRLRELQVLTTIAETREASIRALEGQIWSLEEAGAGMEEMLKSTEAEVEFLSEKESAAQTPAEKSEFTDRKRRYQNYTENYKTRLARAQERKLDLQGQVAERRRAMTQLNTEIEEQLYRLLEDLGK